LLVQLYLDISHFTLYVDLSRSPVVTIWLRWRVKRTFETKKVGGARKGVESWRAEQERDKAVIDSADIVVAHSGRTVNVFVFGARESIEQWSWRTVALAVHDGYGGFGLHAVCLEDAAYGGGVCALGSIPAGVSLGSIPCSNCLRLRTDDAGKHILEKL
jgi:hypothetical protein